MLNVNNIFMKIKTSYILIIVIFLIITVRLFYLSVIKKDYYQGLLKDKTETYIKISDVPRGKILDINGNILVDNLGIKTIIYHKSSDITLKEEIDIATKLASIIELDDSVSLIELKNFWLKLHPEEGRKLITEAEYQKYKERKLTSNDLYQTKLERITDNELNDVDKKTALIYFLMNKGYSYEPKVIKTSVSDSEFAKIHESNIKGIVGTMTYKRIYPYGDSLRSILGNIGAIPMEEVSIYQEQGYSLNDIVGISYLERQYEKYLKSTKSIYKVNSDNTLTLVKKGQKGNDLHLAIDINLQQKLENALKEEMLKTKKEKNTEYYNHSYVLVSNPRTSEIVSLVALKIVDDHFIDISDKVISSSYTLGSVVKGASSSVNYLYDLIKEGAKITDSCIKLYSVPVKCSFKRLGVIDDISALAYSSNYYQYLTAVNLTGNKYSFNMKLNATKEHFDIYRSVLSSYGLGVKTGIDLPNEKVGIKGSIIADDLLLNLAIGQYDTYTPIELLQYINTIANGKERIALSLMHKITNDSKIIKANEANVLNQVLVSDDDINRIKEGFKNVFIYGTGRGYINKAYLPAGKTGTSESFLDINSDNKVDVKTITKALAAYIPYDNPKYSLVVISPNIAYENGRSSYSSNINARISRKVSTILFEN